MLDSQTWIALARRGKGLSLPILTWAFLLLAVPVSRAAVPADPAERAKVIGQPVALVVQPAVVQLTGQRGLQQVVVTGKYADGSVRDLTAFCEITVEKTDGVEVGSGGFIKTKPA